MLAIDRYLRVMRQQHPHGDRQRILFGHCCNYCGDGQPWGWAETGPWSARRNQGKVSSLMLKEGGRIVYMLMCPVFLFLNTIVENRCSWDSIYYPKGLSLYTNIKNVDNKCLLLTITNHWLDDHLLDNHWLDNHWLDNYWYSIMCYSFVVIDQHNKFLTY